MFGPSISGTKCERDKPIFCKKRWVNQWSSLWNLPTMPKYGSTFPGIGSMSFI